MKRTYTYAVLLFVIVILGAYIRLHGLSTLGLGFDEPQHIYAAKSILTEGEPKLPSGLRYGRSFPFTYLVAVSFKLFGVSRLTARLPSVAFGLLSMVLIFLGGRRLFGSRVGLIGALLMACMPFEVVWSRACRMYSMYQFFFLAGFFALYLGLENRRETRATSGAAAGSGTKAMLLHWNLHWIWLSVSAIALLIAYSLQPLLLAFGLSVVAYLSCMLAVTFFSEGAGAIFRSKYLYLLISATAAAAVLLFAFQFWDKVVALVTFSPQWSQYMGVSSTYYLRFLMNLYQFPILVFLTMGAIQVLSRMDRAGLFTLISIAVPFGLHSLLAGVQSYRYIYDIFPLILLLAAYAINGFWENEWKSLYAVPGDDPTATMLMGRKQGILTAFLILIFCVPFGYGILNAARIAQNTAAPLGGEYHAQWSEACRFVNRFHKPGEVIIAGTPLAADFSGCRDIGFMLNNGEIDQFRKAKGSQLACDVFSDTEAITSLQDLETVLRAHPSGWLLVDSQRFANPAAVPVPVREFITKHFTAHATRADRTMHVFSWDARQLRTAASLRVAGSMSPSSP